VERVTARVLSGSLLYAFGGGDREAPILTGFCRAPRATTCHDKAAIADVTTGESRDKARAEKAALPQLFRPKGRPGVTDLISVGAGAETPLCIWAIPCSFLVEWRRWIRSPGKIQRPQTVSATVSSWHMQAMPLVQPGGKVLTHG